MINILSAHQVIMVDGTKAAAYPMSDKLYKFHGEYELEQQRDKDGHIFYVAKRVKMGAADES